MNSGYSPEAQAWVDAQQKIARQVDSALADVGAIPARGSQVVDVVAGQLATQQLSRARTRKAGSGLIRKAIAAPRRLAPRGYAFCPTNKQVVHLKGEKRMAMGGVVGTCPLCQNIHYRDN